MMLEFECKVQPRGRIAKKDFDTIKGILKTGGLCILPSDSSYILTGILTGDGVTRDLDFILARNREPMSAAFSSLRQAANEMHLSNMAYDFINELAPKGLTFVPRRRDGELLEIAESCLSNDGTIGIRLTRSCVETQLAEMFIIPSTPIRSADGKEVISAEDAKKALPVIERRMAEKGIDRKIALIDGAECHVKLSSVVKEEKHDGLWFLKVIRESAIPTEVIRRVARKCGYADVNNA